MRSIFHCVKSAVVNINSGQVFALCDTDDECQALMDRAFKHYPAGRVEQLGFRIRRVVCELQVIPPATHVPMAHQPGLFAAIH